MKLKDIQNLSPFERYNKKALVVSAFPGTGKTTLFNSEICESLNVLDSDSSTFDKSEFPANYMEHIKSNLDGKDLILVSSHKEVREALVENNIEFILAYPTLRCKEEYIQRYIDRGSPEAFVKLLTEQWDNWISEMESQQECEHSVLGSGIFLEYML